MEKPEDAKSSGEIPPTTSQPLTTRQAGKDAAIKKHQDEHMKNLPESVLVYDESLKSKPLPDVHPGMHEYKAYEAEGAFKKEKFTPSSKQKFAPSAYKQPFSFDQIIHLTSQNKYIALVGPPGSGKTTLSKQLAKLNYAAKFYLRFRDLNYKQPLTYKQLFVDYLCTGLDDKTKENAFQWMIENQDKCVFVFNGYEKAKWSLENMKPLNASYDKPLKIEQLVVNLCAKKFFEKSLLLFTSRPHSILTIPSELRPDAIVHVDDFSTEDMKKLFRALAGGRADELWETLSTKAPQLFGLCHNPLLLQFIIFAMLHHVLNKVKTVTEVFQIVLEQLRYSEHARSEDISKLWKPLGKMAYDAMQEETVIFNIESLGDLKTADVQDIIIAFARKHGHYRLFEGDQLFYFSHQMFQEVLAAKYICEFMSDEEFTEVIPEVVKGGHWSMVRRFLCGLLLGEKKGLQTTPCNTADQLSTNRQGKVEMFRQKLIHEKYMKTDVRGYELIDLLTDLQECSDDEKDFNANHLSMKFSFSNTPISSSAAHALAEILPRLNWTVEVLDFKLCNLNSDTLRVICGGICKMKHKIKFLNLTGNDFGDSEFKIISSCVRKVKKLDVGFCGISDHGKQILYRELEELGLPQSTVNFGLFGSDEDIFEQS